MIITEHFPSHLQELPESLEILEYTERTNWANLKMELKKEFTCDHFEFYTKNGDPYIHYNPLHIDLKIIPQRITTMVRDNENSEKFSLKIQAPLMGCKWYQIKQYEKLCEEIITILPQKRTIGAYWKTNGKSVIIFRRFAWHRLRLKPKKH